MDLKSYEYVVAIDQEKSFSKAAKKLFISQPSLSQYISRLEDSLKVTLFDRNTSPVSLTQEGKLYIEAMTEVSNILTNLEKKFEDISELKIGVLNLGLTPSKSTSILPLVLPKFKKKYPNVELVLKEAPSARLEALLVSGDVDMCIMNLPIKDKNIEYDVLKEENIYVAAPADFEPSSTKDIGLEYPSIELSDLNEKPFILLHPDQRLRQISDKLFSGSGVKPRTILETNSIETAQLLTNAGLGFCFVPESSIKSPALAKISKSSKTKYYAIGDKGFSWTLVIAYKKGNYRTKAVNAFSETAKDNIK
ncbi:MAG: LysR family transcriptional regulator [Firmicutes bacterium]|nr:LysR family transcriptional regulator [Bacillota bacterium]